MNLTGDGHDNRLVHSCSVNTPGGPVTDCCTVTPGSAVGGHAEGRFLGLTRPNAGCRGVGSCPRVRGVDAGPFGLVRLG